MKSVFIHILLSLSIVLIQCTPKESPMSQNDTLPEGANRLYFSTSPYLKQHAHNPVNWYPWGEEALQKAKEEDKPILVSIGYSSCHWCHVMERESFENDSIAAIMNTYFINIKVDREERPDIDQIYMEAVQAMGMQGGWPLNVFLTPDQKPFYGGTYFPPKNWISLLQNIQQAYETKRNEINTSADELAESLATSDLLKYKLKANETQFEKETLDAYFAKMSENFDLQRGGFNRAPKFPMPVSWKFILNYSAMSNSDSGLAQVNNTLTHMAQGGIYDQLGGGFSRYSTDAQWLAPHFEKMLYDNGQLVSLYAEAYKLTENSLYRDVVYETTAWLEREMTDASGGFYAALDADSEGIEGKYYVWDQEEIRALLGEDSKLFEEFYQVSSEGNWEEKNILHRTQTLDEFAKENGLSLETLSESMARAKATLMQARDKRIRPGLDNKILAGWNGLMNKGLTDAYQAFSDPYFLELALKNGNYIRRELIRDGKLLRLEPSSTQQIDGYLEDYAFVIDAFLGLYQATFDPEWLETAEKLTNYCLKNFLDEKEDMFFYTGSNELIARKKELFDNVIPASNSQMALNLYFLGILMDNEVYSSMSDKMLGRIQPMIGKESGYLSNWALLYGFHASPTAEIAIIGPEAEDFRKEFSRKFLPNSLLMGAKQETSVMPLLAGKRMLNDQTTIFVCYNKTCKLPVTSLDKAIEQLK